MNPGVSLAKHIPSRSIPWFVLPLVTLLFIIEGSALFAVFATRFIFGAHFDPVVYSQYQVEKSAAEQTEFSGKNDARPISPTPSLRPQDSTLGVVESATREIVQRKILSEEEILLQEQMERKADQFLAEAAIHIKHQSHQLAEARFQAALTEAPNYLNALETFATYLEEKKEFSRAKLLWERAASIVPPNSPQTKWVNQQLARLSSKSPSGPVSLFVQEIKKIDLPLENMFDLRFRLKIFLNSSGTQRELDPSSILAELSFFDQTQSAGGLLIPMKTQTVKLTAKPVPDQPFLYQTEADYELPRGYFRNQMKTYGANYQFSGYVLKVYYEGVRTDGQASSSDMLGKFALSNR